MRFRLSNDTLHAVERNTGREYSSLVSRPMHECPIGSVTDAEKRYGKGKSHIIPPRGSVYLQMDRVTPLNVVKNFIFNFK